MITEAQRTYQREYARNLRAANPGKVKARNDAYYAANADRLREIARNNLRKRKARLGHAWELWTSAKARARKNGRPFNIELSDIVIADVCPVLGIPMFRGKGAHHAGSPTLDCILPAKGYVKGNVRVISRRANMLKSDGTSAEMRLVLADLERLGL